MSSALEIDGNVLHSIREAEKVVSYSRDYITKLAREHKIFATYVGRQWFVDLESLKQYEKFSLFEQDARNRLLSEERKIEKKLREARNKQDSLYKNKSRSFHWKAIFVSCLVVGVGLFSGFTFNKFVGLFPLFVFQTASTLESDSSTQFKNTVKEYPVNSDVNTLPAVVDNKNLIPNFVESLKSLPASSEGILLIPNQAMENLTAGELFSDEVVIKTADNGRQTAVIVDEFGDEVGREIPLVIIPVKAKDKSEEKNL